MISNFIVLLLSCYVIIIMLLSCYCLVIILQYSDNITLPKMMHTLKHLESCNWCDALLVWYLFYDYNTHIAEHWDKFFDTMKSHNSVVPCRVQILTVFASKRTVKWTDRYPSKWTLSRWVIAIPLSDRHLSEWHSLTPTRSHLFSKHTQIR